MKITKYLPDVLVIVGIYFLSYNFFRPSSFVEAIEDHYGGLQHFAIEKSLSITIIVIGLDIAIRRYRNSKNNKNIS